MSSSSVTGRAQAGDPRASIADGPPMSILVDGRQVSVGQRTTVAAALMNAGITGFRRSVDGSARGPVCGMGICHECRVTIDGVAHQRSCLVVAADGMVVITGAVPQGGPVADPDRR